MEGVVKLVPVPTRFPPTGASNQFITPADGVAVNVNVPAPLLLAPALAVIVGTEKVTAKVLAGPFPQAVAGVTVTFPGVDDVSTVIVLDVPPVC